MKFSFTKLQLRPELLISGATAHQIPFLSVLCPQLHLLNTPATASKIPGYATVLNITFSLHLQTLNFI